MVSPVLSLRFFIHSLLHFVLTRSDEASGLAEDSLQCLKAISGSSDGVHYLLKHQTLQALAGAYVAQNKGG